MYEIVSVIIFVCKVNFDLRNEFVKNSVFQVCHSFACLKNVCKYTLC